MKIRLGAALVAALLAHGALADSSEDQPLLKDKKSINNWPTEISQRPLTLGAGMIELFVPGNVNLSKGSNGTPITLAPSLYFGITDHWMVGVRHTEGICVGGTSNGCAHVYNDVSADTVISFGRSRSGLEAGLGFALNYAPINSVSSTASTTSGAWSGEARFLLRASGGALGLTLAPTINVGLNDRNNRTKWTAGSFDIGGTYNQLHVVSTPENKEVLAVPATLQLQLASSLALVGGIALEGPINPVVGSFDKTYRIPIMGGAVVSPARWLDVGATINWPNLFGRSSTGEVRSLGVFAAFRI
jgi:hypothetical protein